MAKVTADEALLAAVILNTWCKGKARCGECKEELKLEYCPCKGRGLPTLDELVGKAEPAETQGAMHTTATVRCPSCTITSTVQHWDIATSRAWDSNIPGTSKSGFMYIMNPDRASARFVCPVCNKTIEGSQLHPMRKEWVDE